MTRLILPLAIIVAAGSVFFLLTKPLLADISLLRLEKARLEQGLENARKLKEVRDNLIQVSNNFLRQDLDRLGKMLPDNVDNVKLIIDINNLARAAGMSIRNIRIKTEEGQSGKEVIAESSQKSGSVTLGFSVSGPYANFSDFLGRLARSLRLVDVTSASFSSNDKNFYDYSVEVKTYWLK